VDDMDAALRDYPDTVEVLDASRRQYRWRIGVPRDGHLPCGGRCPTLIQWLGAHPAQALPPSGCSLGALERQGEAVLHTPGGERMLRWQFPE
jgi:Glyoxalase-like domain